MANSHHSVQKSQLKRYWSLGSHPQCPHIYYVIQCVMSFIISLLHHFPPWGQVLPLLASQHLANSPAHNRYSVNILGALVRLVNRVIDRLIDSCWDYWVKEAIGGCAIVQGKTSPRYGSLEAFIRASTLLSRESVLTSWSRETASQRKAEPAGSCWGDYNSAGWWAISMQHRVIWFSWQTDLLWLLNI